MSGECVKDICKKCNIPTSQKSLARLKMDIQGLYESLLVGSCPCHGFTKVDGHTGGFYHIVCRHGVRILLFYVFYFMQFTCNNNDGDIHFYV